MPGFTCSACGPFTEHRELTKKFKETSDLNYIYENELIKLGLLMIQHILIVKILLRELFQI